MTYLSTKTYGHELGLSCAFRQHKADSHCNKLHGYALSFKFTFEAKHLDERNWVVDFGSLKELKEMLFETFDHKTLVARDDPLFNAFISLQAAEVIDLVVVDAVGCEAFAKMAAIMACNLVDNARVRLISCECAEHGANSAIYKG